MLESWANKFCTVAPNVRNVLRVTLRTPSVVANFREICVTLQVGLNRCTV
jgi:hypothetical protein